ncbi:hypothetical protein [Sphingobacterium arenae]|uniref:HEAT repeat domain-containing protein n=1 Tax=Sphingobacterium arenae TaxID=1280598 RepID=A0ABR7XZ39_9SPHI|nr:hypothetical protein [Sphingobacterium arenae]MBD1424303.1 hypothetical protein [Sphingobacterium arenae]
MRFLKPIFIMLLVFYGVTSTFSQQRQEDTIRYFTTPTLPQNVADVNSMLIDTGGVSAPKDTLFQLLTARGDPISYYRKISTEVCFDGSCRLLRVDLYWNVTGRYLGFELPPKGFLSKAEHEPFNEQEYQQLHAILADSLSPIGNFNYQNLIPQSSAAEGVDAVTRPTSKDVLPYVVKGAVFTTHKMWNLVYGQVQRDVEHATEAALNPEFLLDMLNSDDIWDRYWALDRMHMLSDHPLQVKDKVVGFLCDSSYNLVLHALTVLPKDWGEDSSFQQKLWLAFDCVPPALKPKLMEKLGTYEKLDRSIILDITDRLPTMYGPVLTAALQCLRNYLPKEPEILRRVTALLDHNNPYIAKQIKKFLQEVPTID